MNYTTQMNAARQGIITNEMKQVSEYENINIDELVNLVAQGKVCIPANKNHKSLYIVILYKSNLSPEEIKSTILQYFYKQKTLNILSWQMRLRSKCWMRAQKQTFNTQRL